MNHLKKYLLYLGLSCSLVLSACKEGRKLVAEGRYTIYDYETNSGTVTYQEVEKYFKIVTLKYDDVVKDYLIIKEDYYDSNGIHGSGKYYLRYTDIKNGVAIIKCNARDSNYENATWETGENIEILEEKAFLPYLLEKGHLQQEYDVNELIEFYENEIENNKEQNETLKLK